ncbi:MAG: diphthine--ammonia ligase [Bacteroidota bacterium]
MPDYKTYFNWSSGKDSALALHYLLQNSDYQVDYLLTTVSAEHQRVSMHGLRSEILHRQLDAIGLPYGTVELAEDASHTTYERVMAEKMVQLKADGFEYAAFGDIFLEDLKKYREAQLAVCGLQGVFPIWKRDTTELIHEFIDLGFKSIVVCVNGALLDASFAGRIIDKDFIKDLPKDVDPCGENGEFHTFCFDTPYFKTTVDFQIGETVSKNYQNGALTYEYWFCDLI